MLKRYMLIWVFAIFAFPVGSVQAEIAPANLPEVRIGDVWRFRDIDGFTKEEIGRYIEEIVDINGNEISVQGRPVDQSMRRKIGTFDRAFNIIDNGDMVWTPNRPGLIFPLAVGNAWTQEAKSYSYKTGESSSHYATARVLEMERIALPFGMYDAFKIQLVVEARSSHLHASISKSTLVIWYVPELNRIGRQEIEVFANGRVRSRLIKELIEYLPVGSREKGNKKPGQ